MQSLKDMMESREAEETMVSESVIGRAGNRNLDKYRNMLNENHFQYLEKVCRNNRIEFYSAGYVNLLRESGRSLDLIDDVVMAMYKNKEYAQEILEGCKNTQDVADRTNDFLESHRRF